MGTVGGGEWSGRVSYVGAVGEECVKYVGEVGGYIMWMLLVKCVGKVCG